jgi:hypothetical protein
MAKIATRSRRGQNAGTGAGIVVREKSAAMRFGVVRIFEIYQPVAAALAAVATIDSPACAGRHRKPLIYVPVALTVKPDVTTLLLGTGKASARQWCRSGPGVGVTVVPTAPALEISSARKGPGRPAWLQKPQAYTGRHSEAGAAEADRGCHLARESMQRARIRGRPAQRPLA